MIPLEECPRFDGCSVNVCPLDPEADKRERIPGDDECKAQRRTRSAIAAKYPELLPAGGLLPREIRRDKRRAAWLALPEDERERRISRLRGVRGDFGGHSQPETIGEGQGGGVGE